MVKTIPKIQLAQILDHGTNWANTQVKRDHKFFGPFESYRHSPKCGAMLKPKRQRMEFKNCLLKLPYWSGKSAKVCNGDKFQVQIQGILPPKYNKRALNT